MQIEVKFAAGHSKFPHIQSKLQKKDQESSKLLVLFLYLKSVRKNAIPVWNGVFGDPEQTRTVDLQRDSLAC